jgi:lysophospholipase L1-like esterase
MTRAESSPAEDSKQDAGAAGSKPASEAFGELDETLAADAVNIQRYERAAAMSQLLDRRLPVSRKILLTALCLAVLVAVPYLHPRLARLRVIWPEATAGEQAAPEPQAPMPAASVGEGHLPGKTEDGQTRARELEAAPRDNRGPIARSPERDPALAATAATKAPPRAIDDPSGHALDRFFSKLERAERKEPGAVARIVYYGDSIVASDFITGKLRRMLQDRFGDAGHGYSLIANAWPGWFHIDVSRSASEEWAVSTCVGPYAEDGIYGLGCASFQAHHAGIWTKVGTADLDSWGRSVSRFEIEFLGQPDGGAVEVLVDSQPRERLETAAPQKELRWHTISVPDGPHSLELRVVDDRPVRLFGVRMERDVPGVTLSALGVTGARARFLDQQDDAQWAKALAAAKPDLVVLAFGSNEITDATKYPIEDYEQTLTAVMRQVKAAVPEASLMLVGPPDMASAKPEQGHSRPHSLIVTNKQRDIAAREGWAFWDQFRAMGGGGSMWSWIQMGLGSQDMFHPTGQGGNVLGKFEYQALMQAYDRYEASR